MNDRSIRLSLVGAVAGLLLVTSPPSIRASDHNLETITLAGRTRFTATETSSIFVHFPKPVDSGDGWDVDVRGSGRIYGFLMRDARDPDGEAGEIVGTVSGRCGEPGCKGSTSKPFVTGFNVGRTLEGVWELYVVADGNPVTVTVTLRGIGGARVVQVDGPVDNAIETLPIHPAATPDGRVYSAGDFTDVGGGHPDYGQVVVWMRGDDHNVTGFGDCVYYDFMPAPPAPVAFVPGCPTSWHKDPRTHSGNGGKEDFWFSTGSFGAAHGQGGWFATDAAVTSAGAVALWLAY